MNPVIETGLFRVELSHPVERNDRKWMQNETLQVLADTLERALEVSREEFPDAVFHAVHRLSLRQKVLVDTRARA